MAKCIGCGKAYADQLRRCPHCGEAPEPLRTFVPADAPETARPRRARPRVQRIALFAVAAAALGVGAVLAWPRADDPAPEDVDPTRVLGSGMFPEAPMGLVEEIKPSPLAEAFEITSVRHFRDGVVVEGTCSPDAIARVLVNDRPAVLAPSADRWSAFLPRGTVAVQAVAEGVAGDRAAKSAVVEPDERPGDILRLMSHADGSTLHAARATLRFGPSAGPALLEEVALTEVLNRIRGAYGSCTLYRAPKGLVVLRTSSQGNHVFLREIDGVEMVLVPGGLSRRGAGTELPNGPLHVVRLDPFLIDRAEVTCRQYALFLAHVQRMGDATLRHHEDGGEPLRPAGWTSDEPPEGAADLPVRGVNWYAAFAYARWAGGSLPTEAQWERAAAGPFGHAHPWGDAFEPHRCRSSASGPVAADSMAQGESFYGLLHMSGNVREWCEDRYDPRWYVRGPRTNPRGPSRHKHRVIRGGSYGSDAEALWLQFREHMPPATAPADCRSRVGRRWADLQGEL